MRVLRGAFIASALVVGGAQAADLGKPPVVKTSIAEPLPKWFFHLGPGGIFLSESAKIRSPLGPVAGSDVSIDPQASAIFELGYFVTPEIGVSFTGGLPPLIKIQGAGTIAGLGTLGKAVYGPTALTVQYHFRNFGSFQPYIGAGLSYMHIFSTKDGALTNLKINHTIGPALQVGADFMINEKWGAFVDVKKAFLRTKATGMLGATPIRAWTTVDPLVVHSGITYRF